MTGAARCAQVAQFLSNTVDGDADLFQDAGLGEVQQRLSTMGLVCMVLDVRLRGQ